VSLTTRKNQAQAQASAGLDLARRAAPRIGQGVQSARDWTAPRVGQGVHHTRRWAAPRIEQLGRALQETVAPKVSGVLTDTAHRIEPSDQARKRRRWPRVLTGLAIVAAAGGALGALLRRRAATVIEEVMAEDEAVLQAVPEAGEKQDSEAPAADVEVGVNGRAH
jgi:hypothetical protein